MAEKKPDATDPGNVGGVAQLSSGSRHLIFPYQTANVDDTDTFTFGGESVAHRVAWEPDDATDLVSAVLNAAGTVVTFASTGDNHTGYLHVWMNG